MSPEQRRLLGSALGGADPLADVRLGFFDGNPARGVKFKAGRTYYSDYGRPANAESAAILNKAREIVLNNVESVDPNVAPKAVWQFMASQGFPKPPEWCAAFVSAMVKSAGVDLPREPTAARSWRGWGRPVAEPMPGDVAVYKPDIGDHAVVVDSAGYLKGGKEGPKRPFFWGIGESDHHNIYSPYAMEDMQGNPTFDFRRKSDVYGPIR